MLQVSVINVHLCFQTYVANVFIWMLHMFHTYVVSVLSRCCVCFTMVFKCVSCVFASVSDAFFKCFICLQTYIASVAYGCFKSRSGIASPSSHSAALPQCFHLLLALVGHPNQRHRRASPPPLLLDAGGASWDDDAAGDGPPRVHAGRALSVPLHEGEICALVSSVMR